MGGGMPTPPMQLELSVCSETLEHTIQKPGNRPKKDYKIQNRRKCEINEINC